MVKTLAFCYNICMNKRKLREEVKGGCVNDRKRLDSTAVFVFELVFLVAMTRQDGEDGKDQSA